MSKRLGWWSGFLLACQLSGCGVSSQTNPVPPPASPPPGWNWLAQTRWAVPPQDLRAYLLRQGTSEPIPLTEQMVLQIERVEDGLLTGQARVQTSIPTPLSDGAVTSADLAGSMTPEGRLDLSLTNPDGRRTRISGALLQTSSGWKLQIQSVAGSTDRLVQNAGLVLLAADQTAAELTETSKESEPDPWSWLPGTSWYVPVDYLLAYVVGPPGRAPLPISDQTLYTLQGYDHGYFWGPTTTTMTPDSGVGKFGTRSSHLNLLGCVSPQGSILLSFSPSDPDNPAITGYGVMQRLDGEWTMENQMASESAVTVTHWAYMKQVFPGVVPSPPLPVNELPGQLAATQRWAFLKNSSWQNSSATQKGLLSNGFASHPATVLEEVTYAIRDFRSGYFSGTTRLRLQGQTEDFNLAGSVTPEGALYLFFIPTSAAGATSTVGLGSMRAIPNGYTMQTQTLSPGEVQLVHWSDMLRN